MFGLGKKRGGPLYAAVFDIGSESVGIAIIESDRQEGSPKVIFSHRVHLRITKKKLDYAEHMRQMREALFSASLILSRDGLEALTLHHKRARVSQILVSASAPWSHTISRSVSYDGESELKVSRELMHDLVASAETEIQSHIDENPALTTDTVYDIVERATIDVRINDYTVAHPIGLKGRTVSLAHITGLIPRDVITLIGEVEEKVFPNTTVRAHTFMLMLFCVVRDLFPRERALTIIHVTGGTTEFGIVEDDTLVETLSIPVGLETIVRNMITKESETAKEMYSLLLLYSKGELTPEAAKAIEINLGTYTETLRNLLAERIMSHRFPGTVFLMAPSPFTGLFKKVLSEFVTNDLHAKGEILSFEEHITDMTQQHDAEDVNIAVASRFFHKLHGCGETDTL